MSKHEIAFRIIAGIAEPLEHVNLFLVRAQRKKPASEKVRRVQVTAAALDFVDSLQESGFKIENPNASNSCGCGQSFAA